VQGTYLKTRRLEEKFSFIYNYHPERGFYENTGGNPLKEALKCLKTHPRVVLNLNGVI